MDKSKILSGDQLVAKAQIKSQSSLPELGTKDVIPNKSWLERKQVQAALEARKHLVEIEHIEKQGSLSYAQWLDDINLAEVTQKSGCWQFFGHNIGTQLFLYPEEALFLIETNSLKLSNNGVTVSIQQAYSLLLKENNSLLKYKVYASLSRVGNKLFRYVENIKEKTKTVSVSDSNTDALERCEDIIVTESLIVDKNDIDNIEINTTSCKDVSDTQNNGALNVQLNASNHSLSEIDNKMSSKCETMLIDTDEKDNLQNISMCYNNEQANEQDSMEDKKILLMKPSKLQILKQRLNCMGNCRNAHEYFENIADIIQKRIITIKTPSVEYVPSNIVFNRENYMLNLDRIKRRNSLPNNERSYSSSDDVSEANVGRVTNRVNAQNWTPPFYSNTTPQRPNYRFRQSFFRPSFNFYNPQMFFQRPNFFNFVPNFHNFAPRFQYSPRMQPFLVRHLLSFAHVNSNTYNSNNRRKRYRDPNKNQHLVAIKKLANKLKQLIMSGNTQEQNISALNRLLETYNHKYRAKLRLNEQFELIESEENIVETIEINDDEEEVTSPKRPRLESDHYEENLNKLRDLAKELSLLEKNNKAHSRHRRAFSNAIKTFNNSYSADIYMTAKYDIVDKNCVTLDSSSDSDCIVDDAVDKEVPKSKLLKNPFNIFKRLSQKHNANDASTSQTEMQILVSKNSKYNEVITKIFNKDWLLSEDDFGRAEVPLDYSFDKNGELIFDFVKSQPDQYDNWLEAKIAFWNSVEKANEAFQNSKNVEFDSLVKLDDCADTLSVLNKLRIIGRYQESSNECKLNIDFDVYNRDVQNFRKSNRPKPHFRVICVDESSPFPSGADIETLHSKLDDGVPIMFAVVGMDSISYVQMNPIDLPVYIPSNE